MKDDELKKFIKDSILTAGISTPQCECKDGGLPDKEYNWRYFCKCLRCGWYISRQNVVNTEL